jgi:hypothetical protein
MQFLAYRVKSALTQLFSAIGAQVLLRAVLRYDSLRAERGDFA